MARFLYTLTIFLNALLLFLVQPMFARLILPLLGGAPAVWNTALLFYQTTLLLGYAWVHLSRRWFGLKGQVGVHLAFMALVFLLLPIGVPVEWKPPTGNNPVFAVLGVMAVGVGLPFFVVSAGSPLLQSWFSATGHKHAADPYFLYAASNAGSLLALLAYPFLLEPGLALNQQSILWAGLYSVLFCLTFLCAVFLLRVSLAAASETEATGQKGVAPEPLTRNRILRWVLLAFVPTSWMGSITTYLSTDVAAVPLFWVFPLALFLLTFILAFGRKTWLSVPVLTRAFPVVVVALTVVLLLRATQPLVPLIGLHLIAFFLVALLCHSALAADRPNATRLTEFYLWISTGGALGGLFNALIAPAIFPTILEYPVTLVLACLLIRHRQDMSVRTGSLPANILQPIAIGALTLGLHYVVWVCGITGQAGLALTFGIPTFCCFLASMHPLRFGLSLACVLLVGQITAEQGNVLYQERSFFGVNRVTVSEDGRFTRLYHGHILHGQQFRDPIRRREPTAYYGRGGPIGQVFAEWGKLPTADTGRVAVVGLGAGALAAYAKAGQSWTFYEIDPVVVHIAKDPRFFSFLADCPAPPRIVLGDARLSLGQTEETYDLLILDAYSSDAIPVHLLTREAMQLYRSRLRPGGVIALHISNAHLNLEPVVAALAKATGLVCRVRDDTAVSTEAQTEGTTPSKWVVLTEPEATPGQLASDPRWYTPRVPAKPEVWTDQYSSLLSVLDLE